MRIDLSSLAPWLKINLASITADGDCSSFLSLRRITGWLKQANKLCPFRTASVRSCVFPSVGVESSLPASKLYMSSVHIQMAVRAVLWSRRTEAKQASFVRHEPLRVCCVLSYTRRVCCVLSCACGPVGTQVRSGLPSVGVERQLATSKLYMSSVHIQMAVPSSGRLVTKNRRQACFV